jgi:asparagine synthase (glutamine-hydrolysing)
MRPQLPPWVTPTAVDSVKKLMRRTASEVHPLAPERGQHSVLWGIREGARLDRHLSQITAGEGVPISFPFYDDNVIESALAVRLHERTSPFSYKPLLTAAMRGVVPEELLGRRTKGEYTADVHAGFRNQRNELDELLTQPILADLGLIDADALRRACFGLFPPGLSLVTLETTLLLECWLRAHTRTSGAQGPAALRGYVEVS